MHSTNITAPRVPLTDERTGLVSREWYRFFLTLFELTGAGQNVMSITDTLVGPPAADPSVVVTINKAIQAGQVGPPPADTTGLTKAVQALQLNPPTADTLVLLKALQAAQVAPPPADLGKLTKDIQALQLAPPVVQVVGPVTATATLDFPNTAAQTSSDLTITVPDVVDGDVVTLAVPNGSVLANSCYTAWVSAAGTVTVRFSNYSAAAQNPASGLFRVVVTRF